MPEPPPMRFMYFLTAQADPGWPVDDAREARWCCWKSQYLKSLGLLIRVFGIGIGSLCREVGGWHDLTAPAGCSAASEPGQRDSAVTPRGWCTGLSWVRLARTGATRRSDLPHGNERAGGSD